jgi:5-methyltetrahydrofolate--homocysteine methyltransferase
MEKLIQDVYSAVLNGETNETKQWVQAALDNGISAEQLLYGGLIAAMKEVGRLFEEGEYFVPEMLVSARAMQSGMAILRPLLVAQDIKPLGKVVIGTVEGDLHDIGKNLVSMMLEGSGFQMIDLGTNVSSEQFLEAIKQNKPDILGMSALLTTTMGSMQKTITYLVDQGIRDSIKIIVGGAPVTQKFSDDIGADGFGPDASQAAIVAKTLMGLA